MKTIKLLSILSVFALAACADPDPLVASFNGDSVEIQQSTFFTPANPQLDKVQGEANRICGKVGKQAEYASSRPSRNYEYSTHLFLCL